MSLTGGACLAGLALLLGPLSAAAASLCAGQSGEARQICESAIAATASAPIPDLVRPLPVPSAVLAALPEKAGAYRRQGMPVCEQFSASPDQPAIPAYQCAMSYGGPASIEVTIRREHPRNVTLCEDDCGDGDRGGGRSAGRWITLGGVRMFLSFSPGEENPALGSADGSATVGVEESGRTQVSLHAAGQKNDLAVEALARGLSLSALAR